MFKNYLKVGVRNILKYKVFSFINVFGLAVAMSICMLIILMLADRHRYDQFHSNKDRIYRILSFAEGNKQPYATSPNPLAAALGSEYPAIEETTSLIPEVGGDGTYQQRIAAIRGYFTDPAFFRVFDFELEEGNRQTALVLPNSIVISKTIAKQLFGSESPIGKSIEFSDRRLSFPIQHDGVGAVADTWGIFQVTGVIDETKYLSHIRFDALMSHATLRSLYAAKKLDSTDTKWDWYFRTYTYALLAPDKKKEDLAAALNDLVVHKYAGITSEQVKGFTLLPQALGDIQLGLAGNDTDVRMPLIGYYFLIILASIIMLTACLNYTNLSIARALTRAKEIGVRKVTGAAKNSLVLQFLSESVITTLLSMLMAVVFLYFLKEAFKGLWVNQYLNFELPSSPGVYVIFIAFALLIGLVAGIYPAFHLSKYQPIQALKNLKNLRPGKLGLRKVLGISQFVISLFFITTSLLVLKQFNHFMEFDYGFTSRNIINVELQGQSYKTLANEFSSMKEVSTISASDIIPATGRNNGMEIRKPNGKDEYVASSIIIADENFAENLELKIVAGRNLPPAGEGADRYIVINEEAAHQLGYANASDIVGQTFETKWDSQPLEVIGVVANFRYQLLINRHEIGPLVLRHQPGQFQYLQVKVESGKLKDIISAMEARWKKLDAVHPFKYDFFDEQLASTHKGIFDLVSILGFIAFLAIVISCLGLLGMAIYTAERKTKEVGIRKVMGAADWDITWLLSLEFVKLLGMSILIGAPLSYFINQAWLQYFPNRVEFGSGIVVVGSIILLLLGLLTIGSQTFRAARNNPVEALKNE